MTKEIKNDLVALAKELYESSKETIGEVLEMDIDELDFGTLEFESNFIGKLATMVDMLNKAEMNNELDSVDDKLDLAFLREEFDSRKELKSFIGCVLYNNEPVIDSIVELIYKR